jgi:hypothetical protein
MSLVGMPERHEQWSSWGEFEPEPGTVQRVGINFGAPGDRMTRRGTLWLEHPSVGGPSPRIAIETTGNIQYEYRHSLFMHGQSISPWVTASVARGLRRMVIKDMKPGKYQARLYFAQPQSIGDRAAPRHVQGIQLQGRLVETDFDILAEAGGTMRSVVKSYANMEVTSDFTLELSATDGQTVISGVELIRE